MEFIDLKAQYATLKSSIDCRIHSVLEHAQFVMGPEVEQLERELARRTGAKHCVGCASGTDAILIAMMALGIRADDEVITTPFTFVSTAETIALLGAQPVFVDIDARTYNIDPTKLEQKITPHTKAIIAVSLYGQCAEMDAINAIAERHNLPVIEDAAQSFGATYRGRKSCNLSTIGCTSFFPSKPLGCYGDGGACFTNNDALATAMKQIRVHGQDRRYHHPRVGINGRLDTLQAAILLAKLESFEAEIAARQRVGKAYTARLEGMVQTPYVEPHNTSVYAQYTIQVNDRDVFQQELKAANIPTAVHYPVPLHLQPAFRLEDVGPGSFPQAEAAARRVISLPMHPYLRDGEIDRVAEVVSKTALLAASDSR